jgi:hypothetical protein
MSAKAIGAAARSSPRASPEYKILFIDPPEFAA